MKATINLGKKYTCNSCKARFYDLQKDPPTCPMCDNVYVEPKVAPKVRRQPRVISS